MRVIVTGGAGQLGRELERALAGHDATLLDIDTLDVTNATAVEGVLEAAHPDAIIHAAAWTDVDGCERDPARAHAVNVAGTEHVARAAGQALAVLVSTDYVFDGELGRPYVEDDATSPIQVYGETKAAAEAAIATASRWAVARTAWLYGARRADGERAHNFVASILRASERGPLDVVDDQVGSPTWVGDLAEALVRLVEAGATGMFHVANGGAASRYELARAAVEAVGRDPGLVRPVTTATAPPHPARRPRYAPLDCPRWRDAGFEALPPWEDALARAIDGFAA